ncbi:MAG: transglutaminase domain-containing protein [Alphaproteobacteria bacterium]|nr:transglutaminase domain-containing protein [Alphaproteobacteria bacterium]
MRQVSWLTLVEALGLVVWLLLAGALVLTPEREGELVPIDPKALEIGEAQETWMGIYFQGQKVGYAANSEAPTADGGVLIRNRSAFSVASFGAINQVVTAGNAVIDAEGRLRAFDFFMSADPVRIAARGEVRDRQIIIELLQAGEVERITLDVDEPPQMSVSLNRWFAQQEEVRVGDSFQVPYFDPVTLAQSEMQVRVTGVELLPSGEEAWWLERSFGGVTSRALVTPGGETVREEGAMGMAMVRETAEVAQTMPEDAEPVDIISLSAVKLVGKLTEPRTRASLALRILGVEPERVMNDPPVQTVEGDVVRVRMPLAAELSAGVPRVETDTRFAAALAPTPFLPVQHPEILAKAEEVLGGIGDRKQAAQRLTEWVHEYLYKAPTIGVPNALEILRVGQGDCNEHTALYVALARASGVPARIAAGVVFSDRIGSTGAFYYHAWPEVWLGEQAGWVPVDPTFGQFPADATHVKLVEGDLERQIEIMGVMGRLSFELVKETDEPSPG